MELCEELLMRDVGWRRRRRATSFWQKAASSPCVRYNTTTITQSTNTSTILSFFYIWKQTNSFEFSILAEFVIAQYQNFFQLFFLGLRQYFKCLSFQQVLLSLSLSDPTMGFPQVVRLRSTMSSWLLIDNDPA